MYHIACVKIKTICNEKNKEDKIICEKESRLNIENFLTHYEVLIYKEKAFN